MPSDVPKQYKALVLHKVGDDFDLQTRDTPRPGPGSAIVQILAVGLLSYQREIYNGDRPYPFPLPLVGGCSAVGRVAALGPDATLLEPGQLVWVDCVVRGRDNQDALYLWGIHEGFTGGSRKLMRDVWRDGTFAEFAKVPLENCISLDEVRLSEELGYSVQDLAYLSQLLVPYGGLRDIKLEAGETVIVAPATGPFGGAGVQVAVAMGARVIAMGRNEKELTRLKAHVLNGMPSATVEIVKITGDERADTSTLQAFGIIDAVLDLSPPQAAKSTHLKSAIGALRRGGRISVMGYVEQPIVDWKFMGNNLALRGKLMYEREDMLLFVKMLERGLFPLGKNFVDAKSFGLDNWKEAFAEAAKHTGIGRLVTIAP
jgi:threonine dehydrogenase-like Zn-dependent dehydrogenase